MRNSKSSRTRRTLKTVPLLPRIKICGLTRPDEARAAVAIGAQAIGIVHHTPSPRSASVHQTRRIVEAVAGEALTVAVLVDASPDDALDFMAKTGTTAVQLCGYQQPGDWTDFPHPVFRRLAVDPAADYELDGWKEIAALFVLDHPAGPGGTGRAVDLAAARRLARRAPCLLAGGLSEQNVEERIAEVRPYGVDASSRLEVSPGRKDIVKAHAFLIRSLDALGPVHGDRKAG